MAYRDWSTTRAPSAKEVIPCSGKEPGRIIGRGGVTINRLQEDTGARIDILRDEQQCVISGEKNAVAAALSAVRLVMSEGDGPPGPWSDEGAAKEVRQGLIQGGDFVEEIVPCTGLGPGRVIGGERGGGASHSYTSFLPFSSFRARLGTRIDPNEPPVYVFRRHPR